MSLIKTISQRSRCRFVYNTFNLQTGNLVKIDIPKEFHMVSGQLCELDLILRREEGVGVPNQALLDRRDNRRAVFVVRDGRAEEVEVKTGIVDGKWTMLLNPAALKGLPVVVEGQAFLGSGDRVDIAPAGKEGK